MAQPEKFISWKQERSPILTPNKFTEIRYAQCWEDTDILMASLDIQPHHVCLSIASGGDNTLALLTAQPKKVIALDFSLAQIACLELRAAAYQNLSYQEMLSLLTSQIKDTSKLRLDLFLRCKQDLSPQVRKFWGDRQFIISQGLMSGGKFERYLTLFRRRILPLIHSASIIRGLFQQGDRQQREIWFAQNWNTWRWQLIFRLFFSRFVMGRLGRDPSFFKYVDDHVAASILQRANSALVHHNPQLNAYLQWIALGAYQTALPYALRPENFEIIRNHLNRLEIHHLSLKDYQKKYPSQTIDRFNLSNIFEWMSLDDYAELIQKILNISNKNARLMYWNLLVDRHSALLRRSPLKPQRSLAEQLYQNSKIFFYKRLVIEDFIDE